MAEIRGLPRARPAEPSHARLRAHDGRRAHHRVRSRRVPHPEPARGRRRLGSRDDPALRLRAAASRCPSASTMLVMNARAAASSRSAARGWRYGARTIYGTVVLSRRHRRAGAVHPPARHHDPLLAALYGGAITGLGLGLVFKAGGNTGGTDIIAQLLARKDLARPRSAHARGRRCRHADGGARVRPEPRALRHRRRVRQRRASSTSCRRACPSTRPPTSSPTRPTAVADVILNELGRGATGFSARGLYTGSEREVIFTVVSRRELDALKALVRVAGSRGVHHHLRRA